MKGNANEQHPDFLLERELAARWRLSVRTLQRWRNGGVGPAWLKIRGRVIYPWPDVREWEQQALRAAQGGKACP